MIRGSPDTSSTIVENQAGSTRMVGSYIIPRHGKQFWITQVITQGKCDSIQMMVMVLVILRAGSPAYKGCVMVQGSDPASGPLEVDKCLVQQVTSL